MLRDARGRTNCTLRKSHVGGFTTHVLYLGLARKHSTSRSIGCSPDPQVTAPRSALPNTDLAQGD